jgi:hypothetical protein
MLKGGEGWLYFDRGGGGVIFGGVLYYYYNGYVFIIWSNVGLTVSAKVSFICKPCLRKLYMWLRSSVLSNWPYFSLCSIYSVWVGVPHVCPVSSIC